jgi:hypothetical protein
MGIYGQMQDTAAESGWKIDVSFDSDIRDEASLISCPVNITWLVARMNGTTDPNHVYIVTGTRILADATSGTTSTVERAPETLQAAWPELACAVAKMRLEATMIFATTPGQGHNTYDAAHLAPRVKVEGAELEAKLNDEIVGTGGNAVFGPINKFTIRCFGASTLERNALSTALESKIGIIGAKKD